MKCFRLLALLVLSSVVVADETVDQLQHTVYMGENGVIVLTFQIQVGGKSPQQSFQRYVDGLMSSLDVNADGIVTETRHAMADF